MIMSCHGFQIISLIFMMDSSHLYVTRGCDEFVYKVDQNSLIMDMDLAGGIINIHC